MDKNNKQSLKIFSAIRGVLNDLEYLACGVHQETFDKEIIKKLYKGMIIKAAVAFHDYIIHVNKLYGYNDQIIYWIELSTLAQEYKEAQNPPPVAREPAG